MHEVQRHDCTQALRVVAAKMRCQPGARHRYLTHRTMASDELRRCPAAQITQRRPHRGQPDTID
jgi:hypothetical protein